MFIKARSFFFLSSPSVIALSDFLAGYAHGGPFPSRDEELIRFEEFNPWLSNVKFNRPFNVPYRFLLTERYGDTEEAFQKFFEYYEEFRRDVDYAFRPRRDSAPLLLMMFPRAAMFPLLNELVSFSKPNGQVEIVALNGKKRRYPWPSFGETVRMKKSDDGSVQFRYRGGEMGGEILNNLHFTMILELPLIKETSQGDFEIDHDSPRTTTPIWLNLTFEPHDVIEVDFRSSDYDRRPPLHRDENFRNFCRGLSRIHGGLALISSDRGNYFSVLEFHNRRVRGRFKSQPGFDYEILRKRFEPDR